MYEYHEYRVDTQRWTKWPKALIMTHEWSTDGNDRRLEQRRYVPDDYATQLEMENCRIKAEAEYQKKLADVELEEAHAIRHNIDRLRERVHEVAADRDRMKAENAKLMGLLQRTWDVFHEATTREFDAVKNELRELGIKVDCEDDSDHPISKDSRRIFDRTMACVEANESVWKRG